MKWKDWLEKWGLSSLSINAGVAVLEWSPKDPDRKAAWDLYIELLTRVATQDLAPKHGDEKTALLHQSSRRDGRGGRPHLFGAPVTCGLP